MDFQRLPPALRWWSILLQNPRVLRRLLSTTVTHDVAYTPSAPPSKKSQIPPPPAQEQRPLLHLTSSTLNTYTTLPAPTPLQLRQSNAFFQRHDPILLYTAARFLELPPSPYPEIAVLGRSNVGKSSLLNALFGRPRLAIAHTSKKPGKTRTINGYGVGGDGAAAPQNTKGNKKKKESEGGSPLWKSFGRGGLLVVDMPGYGGGSREDWGKEIMRYIENRKQLRRTYVLVDSEHGLKKSDIALLMYFRQKGIPYQIVLSKVDKLLFARSKVPGPEKLSNSLLQLGDVKMKVQEMLNEEAKGMGMRGDVVEDILCSSGNPDKAIKGATGDRKRMIGVDELRWNILTVCGMQGSEKLELGKAQKQKMMAGRG
ncbi:hypothetical protein M409DRAFT_26666 [Zasmidium cellare ATCC 36951]|uniref:EngB-type G domain-containing protein n=1 Tax=Zasmidium cellare ATCC 36951 TaxID=1080233 RepID=A0A6A6C6Y9_ZASCE|nr:uncharacterized protein M409DRAFT_26666 [Zasmidium cellare ATCC 36951]KAF2162811.1 hypothetical protein M409DRAFT_26666 [Zasmidium cellare ATCC 36951]